MHRLEWYGKCYSGLTADGEIDEDATMLHNGDFSGEVRVDLSKALADVETYNGRVRVSIPFDAMKALVLKYFRDQVVEFAEQASDETFEKLLRRMLNVHNE